MSAGWKLTLIVSAIIVVAFMFINAFALGNAGNFIQTVRESGINMQIPSPFTYWNLRFITILVGALFGCLIFVFLKDHW